MPGVKVQLGWNSWPSFGPSDITDSNGLYEIKAYRGRHRVFAAPQAYSNGGMPEFSLFEGETENINIPVSYYAWITGTIFLNNAEDVPDWEQHTRVYLDRNDNYLRDNDEPISYVFNRSYQFTTTTPGPYTVRLEMIPENTRRTSGLPTGTAVMGQAHEHEQINLDVLRASGKIFFDRDRDGKQDEHEVALSKISILLDKNKNGRRDAHEPVYKTDSKGRFRFPVPYGASRLKLMVPARYARLGLFSTDWLIRVLRAGITTNIALRARR